ncbi:MAG: type II secretion system protein, partial [Candidatus Moranbacteria bacterium]|nr:type II secretion system protein [Candidatus Moranbacteria bacterium]
MIKNYKNTNKAFTLIELLVVVAIIGILSTVVIASLNGAREKGKIATIKSTLKQLYNQASLNQLEKGSFVNSNPPYSNLSCT